MRRLLVLPPLLIVLLCGFLAVQDEAGVPVEVQRIRLGEDTKGQTRIVLDLDSRPTFLLGPAEGAGPELLVQIDRGRFMLANGTGSQEGKGLVSEVTFSPGLMRLSLNTEALPSRAFILPPAGDIEHFRLVIDIDTAKPYEFAEQVALFRAPLEKPGEPAAETASSDPIAAALEVAASGQAQLRQVPPPSLKPSRSVDPVLAELSIDDLPTLPTATGPRVKARPLIVLDPGHGGKDPGAIGRSGTTEKSITLTYSKALKTVLERRGYDVLLTREDDTYVALDERIGLAREVDADLFLSVHADAIKDPTVRGASGYTLSDKRSERLEDDIMREGNFVIYDVELNGQDEVGGILLDLAQSATMQNSDRLATALIDDMRGTMPLVKNPKRRGSLLVLLSPDVPAVLVELAFMSNSADEKNLRSPTWRRAAIASLADGVDSYFDESGIEQRLAGGGAESGFR